MGRWDPADLKPWRDEYLAGFHAALPTIGVGEARREAERLFASAFWSAAKVDAGFMWSLTDIGYGVSDVTWKPIMLPIWFGHYRCQNKDLWIAVNGHTGEAVIQQPGSPRWIPWMAAGAVALIMGYMYYKLGS